MKVGILPGQWHFAELTPLAHMLLHLMTRRYKRWAVAIDGNELTPEAPLDLASRLQMLRMATTLDVGLIALAPSESPEEWSADLDHQLAELYAGYNPEIVVPGDPWTWGSQYCGCHRTVDFSRVVWMYMHGMPLDDEQHRESVMRDCPRGNPDFRAGVMYAVERISGRCVCPKP